MLAGGAPATKEAPTRGNLLATRKRTNSCTDQLSQPANDVRQLTLNATATLLDDGRELYTLVTVRVDDVLLAAPRGFCAGVEMAIKALAWLVKTFEPPVYCYHEIIHNQKVVRSFEDVGVVFIDDIAEVPAGSPVMLSAHGSAPEVVAAARERGGYMVDAVCPLVTKVHHEVKTRTNRGYEIVYVGHKGHEEAVGTMAVAPDAIHRVQHPDDVAALGDIDSPVAILAQTTLSHREWQGVLDATKQRFPDVWQPARSDLCFATTNRQAALVEISAECDAVLVIGSSNSSNTLSLVSRAKEAGCPRVLRINDSTEIPDDISGTVGVTAGASAPEDLVRGVLERLASARGVREVTVAHEDEYFPPPRNLRNLLSAVDIAFGLTLGAPNPGPGRLNDRQIDATDVLTSL